MTRPRPPKKSEMLEVRLPYEVKTAFMARCRSRGRTASEAVRGFIEREVAGAASAPPSRIRAWQALLIALAGLAAGAVAAPSLAQPMQTSRSAFERLDRNHDGVLSFEEFRAR